MTEKKEIFHPWGKANINQTELWLSHLAEEGWALESVQGWRFIFRSASPHYRCYFLYRALDIKKHWSGPDDILTGLDRYVYKPYRSLKNDFFEIVSQDIHECNSFFQNRNRKYCMEYLESIAIWFVALVVICLFCLLIEKNGFPLLGIPICFLIPYGIGYGMLRRGMKRRRVGLK